MLHTATSCTRQHCSSEKKKKCIVVVVVVCKVVQVQSNPENSL